MYFPEFRVLYLTTELNGADLEDWGYKLNLICFLLFRFFKTNSYSHTLCHLELVSITFFTTMVRGAYYIPPRVEILDVSGGW